MRPSTRSTTRPTLLEPLEPRTLFSVLTLSHAAPIQLPSPVSSISALPIFLGTNINAFSYQPFTAVLGAIKHLPPLPAIYSLSGQINWGDSTAPTAATFVPNPDGSLSVLGSHDYFSTGLDKITITITANPPAGSAAITRLLGTIQSTASVTSPYDGRTIEPTLHVPFTATLGTFHATASLNNITATIDWGDGTTSEGKILALPVTDPADPTTTDPTSTTTDGATPIAGGLFAVSGSHTYSALGSYIIKVTITYPVFPPTTASANPTPPIILVSQFDAIADVLPLLATAI